VSAQVWLSQTSMVPANPQTFNLYSYVTNSPLTLIDPTGMSSTCPSCDQTDRDRPLQFFSPNQQPTASSPNPVSTQRATLDNAPMCGGPIPTTVVVDQMNAPDARTRDVNGTPSLVVGVDLRFTFVDQQGRRVTNAVVGETVENLEGPQSHPKH